MLETQDHRWALPELKRKLLKDELSLEKIVETCRIFEKIKKQNLIMAAKSEGNTVNKVQEKGLTRGLNTRRDFTKSGR